LSKGWLAYVTQIREEANARRPAPVPIQQLKDSGVLASPIMRYCYICSKYVGVNRMEEHCRGSDHQDRFHARKEEIRKEQPELSDSQLAARAWYPRADAKENLALKWKEEVVVKNRERLEYDVEEKEIEGSHSIDLKKKKKKEKTSEDDDE
jgi:hypothetical protein